MIGERIQLARTARGLNQRQLAVKCNVTAMAISKFERNEIAPTDERLRLIAGATQFPAEFFTLALPSREPPLYRKRASMPRKLLDRTEALASIYIEAQLELLRSANAEMRSALPDLDGDGAEIAAAEARTALGLDPDGPVPHVMARLERAGVVVVQLRTIVDKFDGFSLWTTDRVPAVVIDRGIEGAGDRDRFTLAHELGHLVLHRRAPRELDDAEREADAFASAFLMPARGILGELKRTPLTPVGLAGLKQRWRVSIAALFMRAVQLGVARERDKRDFFIEMSQRGWRKREPVQVPVERPQLLRKAIERLRGERRHLRACRVVRFPEMAALIGLESVAA